MKRSNLKKTYYYLKKNGPRNAFYAALERLEREKSEAYRYQAPEEKELDNQRKAQTAFSCKFSILVPAYETNPIYLREMTDSVLNQTYANWELIIADASLTDKVKEVIQTYNDERIHFIKLEGNKGISANTNVALDAAEGDYIGLLDHDDILTPDALFEMAKTISENEKDKKTAWMLYSDEDKGNGDCTVFCEPHFKLPLNVDLLLSNNYVCHFLVIKSELIKSLGFRPQYDGAQDFDLVLRCMGKLLYEAEWEGTGRQSVVHVPKVLYHWRCHTDSTAENPESKRYAYEAGRMAIEDFMKGRGWKGKVMNTLHLGFYRIEYAGDIFRQRPEVGVIGGKILDTHNKISGGIYDGDGELLYKGLRAEYSGYMHRASMCQEAAAVDVRCMKVCAGLQKTFEEIFGTFYIEDNHTGLFSCEKPEISDSDLKERSLEFCKKVKELGYIIVWTPDCKCKAAESSVAVNSNKGREERI